MRDDCEKRMYEDGDAFCESCSSDGVMTDQHICIDDGGTSWCLMCAWSDGMITKDERRELGLENLKLRESYLTKSLSKVHTELAKAGIV